MLTQEYKNVRCQIVMISFFKLHYNVTLSSLVETLVVLTFPFKMEEMPICKAAL